MLDLDVERLRADSHARLRKRLYDQCDRYRAQVPPQEHPTTSITYFGPAAANLALAYRLTGNPGYLDEAWRWISTCIRYPHWGKAKMPDHDLDAGWLLHGLSCAYTWLKGELPSEHEEELRAKLELQGQRLYEFALETEGGWWASSYWQNHHWICYTGLATVGLALDRPEWTKLACDNMETALGLLPEDGSDAEGVVYWRYGVPWLAVYADVTGHQGDCAFLKNTFRWRLHQCAPGFETNADHGDCHDRRSGHSVALYYWLASRYRIGEAQWLASKVEEFYWHEALASGVKPGLMAEAYLELLWFDPTVVPREPEETHAYFPDLGQITARTSWADDATFVSFKSAPGGGHKAWNTSHALKAEKGWETLNAGHHHPDAGTFVLVSNGAFLAVEDGYANRKRAAYHNVILVDGQGWVGEDRYHVYKDMPYEHRPYLEYAGPGRATAHLAATYRDVSALDRSFIFTPRGRVVILDVVEAASPKVWSWLLHSDWPAIELDAENWLIQSGAGKLLVRRFYEATPRQYDTVVEANPTASTPSLSITRTLRTLCFDTPRVTDATLVTTLDPHCGVVRLVAGGVEFEDEVVTW